jgi:hypothetical protein
VDLLTWDFARWLWPFLMLAALLAALVIAINMLGRRLERHDAWLALLDVRVQNLDKDRKATWVRRLQRPFGLDATEPAPLVPPPLPPRAPTLDATDWRDDDLKTEDLNTRQTGRYPGGDPPKGPNDDDPH